MCRVAVLVLAVVMFTVPVFAADLPPLKGKVESVTLYRGQALVTRVVPFKAPAGAVHLVVADLPESVLPDSLFASAGKGVQVRALRYRAFAVEKAPQEDVRKLDDRIADVEKKTRENAQAQQLLAQQQTLLDGLQSFTAPTAQVEMTKGVLNADTLTKVAAMLFERREELSKKSLALQEDARQLKDSLILLQRQRADLTRAGSKTVREAVVFLDKPDAADAEIRLNYLVANATWEPSYNLRAAGDMASVAVEYNALAQQMSGEDWEDVSLTLSTAAAQMVADGPTLTPLWIALSTTPTRYADVTEIEQRLKDSKNQLRYAQDAFQKAPSHDGQFSSQYDMNRAATTAQSVELTADAADVYMVRKLLTETAAGLSVNYKLDGKVSLASRRENQLVEIARLKLPSKFHYEAVPLLSEYVYRYAQLTNESTISLLEGRASVYLDGDFVGASNVLMVARGQKTTIGFGIDPQLRAWREFVAREERTQGGNKNITAKYRVVLDNYSDKNIDVQVLDRIPVSKADIRVTLGELKEPLSTDAEYLRAFRPRGILRWDTNVPAKSAATTAKTFEYSYTLEFDRNLHISSDAEVAQPAPKARQELREMLRLQGR